MICIEEKQLSKNGVQKGKKVDMDMILDGLSYLIKGQRPLETARPLHL